MDDEEVNPYELLGVTLDSTEADIKSAYRKLSLKVHPDRHPNNPDAAAKFHQLNQAYQVLLDPIQRLSLDSKVKAKEERKKRYAKFDNKRKQMQEELEAAERNVKKSKTETADVKRKREYANEAIIEEGRKMREEREKAMEDALREANTQEDETENGDADSEQPGPLDSTVRLKYQISQYPSLITAPALTAYLSEHRFGPLDDQSVVLSMKASKKAPNKPPKFATALVPFNNVAEAFAIVCASGQERRGLKDIEVSWAAGSEPAVVKRLKSHSSQNGTPRNEKLAEKPAPKAFDSFSSNAFLPQSGVPGLDFESATLMRMRQAERDRIERELREQEALEDG